MRILEILNTYPGETFIRQHASALLKLPDIRLSWAFWQTSSPGRTSQLPVEGLENCVNLVNPNRLSRLSKAIVRGRHFGSGYDSILRKQIKRLKPDLLHFQFASLAVRHSRIADELGLPFTFSVRGSDIQTAPLTIAHYVDGLNQVVKSAAAIHCVSGSLRDLLSHYTGGQAGMLDKTSVIRTAIDPAWSTIVRNPIRGNLLAVGRLDWRKGYPDLLLACKLLKEQGRQSFTLKIVGEGEQREQLEYMIRDMALQDVVSLEGKKSHQQIRQYFSEAELLLLTSLSEGFPNVIGEAMLAGVPFIATNTGGIYEVLPETFSNCVVPVGAHSTIADRIAAFGQMQNKDQSIDEAKRIALEVFSPERHAFLFQQFWTRALTGIR